MGKQFFDVLNPNTAYTQDNSIFDVESGASLNLHGSGNFVIMESGATGGTIYGSNNTISGAQVDGVYEDVFGSNNTVELGNSSWVNDRGTGDNITVGSSSRVYDFGSGNTFTLGRNSSYGPDMLGQTRNATIYATLGGAGMTLGNGDTAYAEQDSVTVAMNSSVTINGSDNQVNCWYMVNSIVNQAETVNVDGNNNAISANGNDTIILNGKGNSVAFSVNSGSELIQSADGYWVKEDSNGVVTYSGSSFSVQNGTAKIGLGSCNVVTVSDYYGQPAGNVSQLASMMASYGGGAASGNSGTLAMQQPNVESMLAVTHN
ncbi:hypothetical protein LMG27952_01244 [Paraburkholderia hiiakae]|uniref:Uncharacterized protein n=1 Tax=Paraburkholderia hiiakae TaxID=1081782 RepID=A0ABM8NED8_9BURK|nr:hypothetical protein [Paraburkholderia hiiakae]CAD6520057.1 hypothetical protein LMG27952_01244 [Paraburkholderia hiiakae]